MHFNQTTWTPQVTGKPRIIHSQRVLDENDQEEAFSSISFQVDESHFKENNSLKVRCTASIYSIYQKTNEIGILLDRPNKAIYKPQVQRYPTVITELPSVKLSRSNVHLDKVYNDNNANNVIESKYDTSIFHPRIPPNTSIAAFFFCEKKKQYVEIFFLSNVEKKRLFYVTAFLWHEK